MKCAAITLVLALLATGALADGAGLRLIELNAPHQNKPLNMSVWYPAGGGGDRTTFAESPVFIGVDVEMGARVSDGAHPIVLFSHGMGGTFMAQAWLAAALAERGAIVVAVDHPNSSWSDFDMAEGVRHWTRAADLSAALDAVLADPDFAGRTDSKRVMAAGFSYGGWTALSLGGTTGNLAGTVAACEEFLAEMEACELLLSDKVRMQDQSPDLWNASYANSRVTHVAAIEPGFVWGLEAGNLAGLVDDVLMIGLGGDGDRILATDFDASGLAAQMPRAKIARIVPGVHFSVMQVCKPDGEAILSAEHDDPVCTDPEGAERAAIHGEIVDLIAEALGL